MRCRLNNKTFNKEVKFEVLKYDEDSEKIQ